MAKAGWELIRESWRIFLEAAPTASTSPQSAPISTQSTAYPDVHDLHVWEVTSGFPALSAHILLDRSYDCHERQRVITGLPQERYGID
jgi:cobalt-zinc-cadmium efflux system protein